MSNNAYGKNDAKMRVCMLVYSFYENDNRVLRYAETLIKRGDQVDVVALRRKGQSRRDQLRGANIFRIQKRKANEHNEFIYLYRLTKFFIKSSILLTINHIRKPYDFIHVHNMPDFLVFAAFFPKIFGARVILDIHDIVPELYTTKFKHGDESLLLKAILFAEKISTFFSDHVIIANHIWYKTITSRSVDEKKCTVIMNYPDENIFFKRPKSRMDDKFIMIYPGSLNWHQGVDIAIKACAIIKNKVSAEFHIYGEGGSFVSLQNLIQELGLQDMVFLKGSLPIYEVANKMANADLGIEPKRNELFSGNALSTKIMEFMTLSIPVIVSDTRIHRYYFNNSAVTFFKPDDEHDLARCMLLLINDADLRTEMCQNNSRFVEDFVWSKRKEEYLKLVDQITQ